jgi:hypothetical protein
MGLLKRHAFAAIAIDSAKRTIRFAVWHTLYIPISPVERGEHSSDWVVVVVVGGAWRSGEQLNFKGSMFSFVTALDEDASSVAHIPRATAWILLVMVIILDDLTLKPRLANVTTVDTFFWFFRISTVPSFDLIDFPWCESRFSQFVGEILSVIVPACRIAHQEIRLSSQEDFKPCKEVLWQRAT